MTTAQERALCASARAAGRRLRARVVFWYGRRGSGSSAPVIGQTLCGIGKICRLCEQRYHGDVACALWWACCQTYLDRPEEEGAPRLAMSLLGDGLYYAEQYVDAAGVYEAELSIRRRLGTGSTASSPFRGVLRSAITSSDGLKMP